MMDIVCDRSKIGAFLKATATVTSSEPFTAISVRDVCDDLPGGNIGRESGIDMLADDSDTVDGVLSFSSPVTSFTFDVEANELPAQGVHTIYVFLRLSSGAWTDAAFLYDSASLRLCDSNSLNLRVQRTSKTDPWSYVGAHTAAELEEFVASAV